MKTPPAWTIVVGVSAALHNAAMSDHYEVVFSCFLRDDTPESVMAALRWHLGMDAEFPENLDDDEGQLYPLLGPDNHNSSLPGGDVVSLRRAVQESLSPASATNGSSSPARTGLMTPCSTSVTSWTCSPHMQRAPATGGISATYAALR